jgi:hypothetical protein
LCGFSWLQNEKLDEVRFEILINIHRYIRIWNVSKRVVLESTSCQCGSSFFLGSDFFGSNSCYFYHVFEPVHLLPSYWIKYILVLFSHPRLIFSNHLSSQTIRRDFSVQAVSVTCSTLSAVS